MVETGEPCGAEHDHCFNDIAPSVAADGIVEHQNIRAELELSTTSKLPSSLDHDTVSEPLFPTKTLLPSGVTATPSGLLPRTGMVAVTLSSDLSATATGCAVWTRALE